MAGHGNPGRIGGHEIQVSVRLAGGHASRCAENLGWNPERDSGLALQHREARKVGGSIRRKPPHGKVAVHFAPNRVQSLPVGRQTSVSVTSARFCAG